MVLVSVVMGVHNNGDSLEKTLLSVLNQKCVDFEFIVVNDGSTDASTSILKEFSRSFKNLNVIHQSNTGLTKALINGCNQAQGKFIARQDCGDISFPDRLKQQSDFLLQNPQVSLVSSWTDFLTPSGDFLKTVKPLLNYSKKTASLDNYDKVLMPTHHGCTMFPRDAYNLVGGYRSNFYFAQDRDLWSRLIEHGDHAIIREVLYQATIYVDSLSGKYALEQRKLKKLIDQTTLARRQHRNSSEERHLNIAKTIYPKKQSADMRRQADSAYFIGSLLFANQNKVCAYYFLEALRYNKFHLKSWLKLLLLKCNLLLKSNI